METYLIYIGKSAIAAGVFYLAFLLLFQNQKHFGFNRIYLPVSLLLSFGIPLITFTTVKYIEPNNFDVNSFAYLAPASEEIIQPAFVLEWYHYLFGLYILGAAGFLFHLLLGHFKAIRIVKTSRIQQLFKKWVNITKKDVHPFSFFSKIVLSEKTLSHPNLAMIVEHENIHVKEKHTLDILFAEILFLLQWFNPFAWLLKDAIKNNLEYLTDHEIAKTHNVQSYQLAMVSLADKKGVAPFLNALNGSQLKNRIVMMKKKTENKYAFVKQLLILPLLAILVMGLSNKEVKTEVKIVSKQKNVNTVTSFNQAKKSESVVFVRNEQIILSGKVINEIGEPVANADIIDLENGTKTISDTNGNYKIEFQGIEKPILLECSKAEHFTNKFVFYGNDNEINIILTKKEKSENEGNVKPDLVNDSDSQDTITTVYKNKKTEAEQIKKYGSPVFYMVEEMPEFPGGETALRKYIEHSIKYPEIAEENGIHGKVYVSFIISKTGEVVDAQLSRGIDPSLDKEALRVASSLPKWKPGKQRGENVNVSYTIPVDFVLTANQLQKRNKVGLETETLEKRVEDNKKNVKIINSIDPTKSPLYIVNGIETANIEAIDPESFKSIDVLKDKSATDIYGEKGKNGVILISTKNPVKFNPGISGNPVVIVDGQRYASVEDANVQPDEIASMNVIKKHEYTEMYGEKAKDGVIVINTKTKYNSGKADPLFIVNGKETGQTLKDLKEIDPETFESVNVLKEEAATKKYGEKGKNGVIEIKLKPENIDTELKLRKFIAEEIKYPLEAVETNTDGIVSFLFRVDKNGNIYDIMKARKKDINLETVVVTAYKTKTPGRFIKNQERDLLTKEVKRVIEKVPVIQIPEFSGKTVQVSVKFVLQD